VEGVLCVHIGAGRVGVGPRVGPMVVPLLETGSWFWDSAELAGDISYVRSNFPLGRYNQC